MIKRPPAPDARLRAAMELCGPVDAFADIGADHGRLSACMLLSGQAGRALVADVSAEALAKARRLMGAHGLEKQAVFAVADGLDALDALPGRVDAAFVLGMGGDTISGILSRGRQRLEGMTLILGAQTELYLLRRALCSVGYRVRAERVVAQGRYAYVLMRAEPALPGEAAHTEAECLLGPCLMRQMPREWLPVLSRRELLLRRGIEAMTAAGLDKDRERLERFRMEHEAAKRYLEVMRQRYAEEEREHESP